MARNPPKTDKLRLRAQVLEDFADAGEDSLIMPDEPNDPDYRAAVVEFAGQLRVQAERLRKRAVPLDDVVVSDTTGFHIKRAKLKGVLAEVNERLKDTEEGLMSLAELTRLLLDLDVVGEAAEHQDFLDKGKFWALADYALAKQAEMFG